MTTVPHVDRPRGDFTHEIPLVDISTLTDEQREESKRKHDRLFAWLAQYPRDSSANGGLMLSRHNEAEMWEHTGFHINPKTQVVNAKVGRHPYQPIGQDDGQHFIPMEHSQRLWCREFALATLRPIDSCFKVEEVGHRKPAGVDDALNDADVQSMTEALEVLREALAREGQEVSGQHLSLLDTLQLTVLRTPRLDRYITSQEQAFFAATGHDMMERAIENSVLPKVVFGFTEWLDMKLQEESIRRLVQETVLKVPEADQGQALEGQLLAQIQQALKGPLEQASGVLNFARSASPVLRPIILAGLEAQESAAVLLERCRDALLDRQPKPVADQSVETPATPEPTPGDSQTVP